MIDTRHRVQLVAFALVTVIAIGYGGLRFLGWGTLLSPPYQVTAEFATSGGIYPSADVDLLGTQVGTVASVEPGPNGTTRVVMSLKDGSHVPRDVTATVADKSAIGEQYVELQPLNTQGGFLHGGDAIPLSRTATPIPVEKLLGDLSALAKSIPLGQLHNVLDEASTALEGVGPSLGQLIDDSDRLTSATQTHADDLNRLIDSAQTVLDTQVALSPTTRSALRQTAGVLGRVQGLGATLVGVFQSGTRAAAEVTSLLDSLQPLLPGLLGSLDALTNTLADNLPAIRKTLVLFPWALQYGAGAIRYCDEFDPITGQPIAKTCHYDAQGRPIYSSHFALQLPEPPGSPAYLPCTQGYEGTRRYQPDGTPIGGGAKEKTDSPVNLKAGCTASPTDPVSPNVRGGQNVH